MESEEEGPTSGGTTRVGVAEGKGEKAGWAVVCCSSEERLDGD